MNVLIPADELRAGVRRLASELSAAYDDGVVLVAVLKGSVPFLADLIRAMTVDPVVDFLAISSYAAGTGRVRLLKDLDIDVCGRDVEHQTVHAGCRGLAKIEDAPFIAGDTAAHFTPGGNSPHPSTIL